MFQVSTYLGKEFRFLRLVSRAKFIAVAYRIETMGTVAEMSRLINVSTDKTIPY